MRKEYDFSRGKRGAAIPSPGKTRITIMLDTDVIEAFRTKSESAARGYQQGAGGGVVYRDGPRGVAVQIGDDEVGPRSWML